MGALLFGIMVFRIMDIHFAKPLPVTEDVLMRAAGYVPFRDPKMGTESYTRRLTGEFYPRFHVYIKSNDQVVTFSLHLDQKKPSYAGTKAHGGEYEGPTVEKEINRMKVEMAKAARGH